STLETVATSNELMRLDHDSLDAYQAAIDAIADDPMARDALVSFRTDCERHVRELEHLIRRLGGVPQTRGGASTGLVTDAATFAAQPAAIDVLKVIKANEDLAVA